MNVRMTTRLACAASLIAMSALADPALAQDLPAQGSPTPATTAQEDNVPAPNPLGGDIIVTGSRIRGVDAVGSNVISIGVDEIAQEPVVSTSDLLRRVPQVVSLGANRQGGSAQNGAANATRAGGINLRGISTNATLLLYNGRRFPPQGTQGQYTDPSVIPTIALERVEVVADGASAIYGSDAIAGVVNFILRRGMDGAEFRARSGFSESNYAEQQLSGIAGQDWGSGWVTVAGEYSHNSALFGRDLDFYRLDNRDRGGRDFRSTNCDPGTITAGGQSYAIPQGGVAPGEGGSLVAGTANRCDLTGYESVIPSESRYSFVGNVSQELGSSVRLFADGFYSHRKGEIAGTSAINAVVPSSNPFFVSPVAGAESVNVAYSLTPAFGPDVNPYEGTFWNVAGGVEVRAFSDWSVTAYYQHGESEDIADRRVGLNNGALNAALADTNPATALNLFGGPNNPDTIAAIRDRLFVIYGKTKLDVVNVQADGSLFDLPGGAVRLAVGGEYRDEYTFTSLDIGSSAASMVIADGGSRDVKAVFGELYVPIVGGGNAMPGIEELSLSVAGRYEEYSDFGSTTNPKIGVTWRPFDALSLRGSYGTSFRAPTFTEVSEIAGGAGLYYDRDQPGPDGTLINGIGIAGGNPDLQPETATTWSLGAEFEAGSDIRLTATYFDIDYKDQIIALRRTPGYLTNPAYAPFRILNPTDEQVAALIASGLPVNSPIDTTDVSFIADGRRQNLGRTIVRGFDFGILGAWDLGEVTMDGAVQGTWYTKYSFESVPGLGLRDVAGTINNPQDYRLRADIGAKWDSFSARLTWNYLPGYDNDTVTPVQEVSDYSTFDLVMGWDVNDAFRFGIDVRNLFDEEPPFVDVDRGYDPQSANPLPRTIAVTAGVKL
ncbi:TonB-dependent receptor plug domain-containing protein [Croceicoccus marinus]|nr:TonB-dependent receptor [Croceicoccus marinus]